MRKKLETGIVLAILAAAVVLVCYMLFHNLGKGYMISTDEAYHATNAYEMYKQSNWIINTYKYAADYFNSKPPLCLDMMVESFRLLGTNIFAARFPSAIGGLLTLLVIIWFLLKTDGLYSTVIFPFVFAACTPLFTFHMYRAAEMDSFFNFFFVIAMISLYEIENTPEFIYLYGISLGMAFMCKGPHAALIFFIGLLYIPKIHSTFKSVKRVVLSVLLAAALPITWMIKRSMFDGSKFINTLFIGETVNRVNESSGSAIKPIADFMTSNVMYLFIITIIVAVVSMLIIRLKSGNKSITVVTNFLRKNYLFLVWSALPVLFFAILRSYLDWYTYTSQLALCILVAKLGGAVITRSENKKPLSGFIPLSLIVISAFFFIIPCIKYDINLAGEGGHPVDEFTQDILDFSKTYGDKYAGRNVYLLSDFRQYKKQGEWECEYVAPAEMYCDFTAVDGTVDNFLNDEGSLIIVDKDLWDNYSSVLTGHVILQDNSYLIFSTDTY